MLKLSFYLDINNNNLVEKKISNNLEFKIKTLSL